MKKLSRWANSHIIGARILIVIIQVAIAIVAIFIADQLSNRNIHFSVWWIYIAIILFFILVRFYPYTVSNPRIHFVKQKLFDFSAALLGFSLVLLLADQLNQPFNSSSAATAAILVKETRYKNPEAQKILSAVKAGEKTKLTSREKKIIRKEFKWQLKKLAVEIVTGKKADGEQTALIILACLAAGGLLYLVAGLACGIGCSGSDVGAGAVAIIGTAAVVWGLVAVIKAINRGAKKRKSTE